MQIVAANHAESLRRQAFEDLSEAPILDIVSGGLRVLYAEADDELPAEMIALVMRLDGASTRVHAG